MDTKTLMELYEYRNNLDAQIKELKANLDNANETINYMVSNEVQTLRDLQGKETGTVTVNVNGTLKVKHTVPKKVKWNQGILANLATMIQESGRAITDFMGVKYDVPEKLWSMFDADTQTAFQAARTIEHGKPMIEIEVLA